MTYLVVSLIGPEAGGTGNYLLQKFFFDSFVGLGQILCDATELTESDSDSEERTRRF